MLMTSGLLTIGEQTDSNFFILCSDSEWQITINSDVGIEKHFMGKNYYILLLVNHPIVGGKKAR